MKCQVTRKGGGGGGGGGSDLSVRLTVLDARGVELGRHDEEGCRWVGLRTGTGVRTTGCKQDKAQPNGHAIFVLACWAFNCGAVLIRAGRGIVPGARSGSLSRVASLGRCAGRGTERTNTGRGGRVGRICRGGALGSSLLRSPRLGDGYAPWWPQHHIACMRALNAVRRVAPPAMVGGRGRGRRGECPRCQLDEQSTWGPEGWGPVAGLLCCPGRATAIPSHPHCASETAVI